MPRRAVMHVDGTVARVNGNNNVVIRSNGAATMYFIRERKGHAGIKDTPVETFRPSAESRFAITRRASTAMAPTIKSAWGI